MNLLPVPFTAAAPQACPDPLWPAKTADNCAGERRRPEWRFVNSWQERRVVLPKAIEAPVVGKATWVDVIRTPEEPARPVFGRQHQIESWANGLPCLPELRCAVA
jgi:hypothetical protein